MFFFFFIISICHTYKHSKFVNIYIKLERSKGFLCTILLWPDIMQTVFFIKRDKNIHDDKYVNNLKKSYYTYMRKNFTLLDS